MITITMQLFDTDVDGKSMKAFAVNSQGEPDKTEEFIGTRILSVVGSTMECLSTIGTPLSDDDRQNCLLLICQAVNIASVRAQERPEKLVEEAMVKYLADEQTQQDANKEINEKVKQAADAFAELLRFLGDNYSPSE